MTGLSEQELAEIRADVELAIAGPWTGVPNEGQRFVAGLRVAEVHAVKLLAQVDLLTAQLAEARARLASYGSPVTGPVTAPPVDEGYLKAITFREELERTGITNQPWADGRGLCSRGAKCTAGPLSVFPLTKRGTLPVHRPSQHGPKCAGSGRKPSRVLRYVPPTEPVPADPA